MIKGAFSCPPQARQLILQYGLTLSDLDRHPEVSRERLLGFLVSFFFFLNSCHLFVDSAYLVESRRRVS